MTERIWFAVLCLVTICVLSWRNDVQRAQATAPPTLATCPP